MQPEDIKEILNYSELKNGAEEVTGVLLFKDGNFLQVLEGKKESIVALYQKIKNDSRHGNIYELFHESTTDPLFKDYNSKFNLVTTGFDLIVLKEYLRRKQRVTSEPEILAKLKSFLGMNWFDESS